MVPPPLRTALIAAALAPLFAVDAAAQAPSHRCETRRPGEPRGESPSRSPRDSLAIEIRAEFFGALRRAAVEMGIEEPNGLVIVEHDRRTGAGTLRLVDSNVPGSVVERVRGEMAARLVEDPDPDPVLVLYRRMDFAGMREGPQADTLRPVVACEPELLNPRGFQSRLARMLEQSAPFGNPRMRAAVLMVVTRDGRVAYARLKTSTGNSTFDRALVERIAPRLRFGPASINGATLDMLSLQPVEIPERRPPPPRGESGPGRP